MLVDKRTYIVGAYEHPTRKAPDKSVVQLHAECAAGALADAGLTKDDVDGYLCGGDAPGMGPLGMVDFLNLRVRYCDSTDIGGSAPLQHVAHAAQAIAADKCSVALITLAGRPCSERIDYSLNAAQPDLMWETPLQQNTLDFYAMCARRHMHDYRTSSEQLAWIKVAASQHAQHNPHAMLRNTVTVEDVLSSPMVSEPLHRLDCCITSDGGGAVVVTRAEVAKNLKRPLVKVIGTGEAVQGQAAGHVELTASAARQSGAIAFADANVQPSDIRYASIYDSFTITVLIALEDLGFCEKGHGGRFVADGKLISGVGRLPINTDGGGLCNNHPAYRGGITKVIEAVRQLRGDAHSAVQVQDCALALVHGTGGRLGARHGSATLILERE
ncbi:thiolase domain-containing protein [Bradyrhizobium sp. CCBAU 11361]|uniref:thiolase domain-containing protein n=1 Tax=Bradyrhizobium sp. CCBAU 11361 TaxID=1630812 RepID=UPI002303A945|nr:thiolase domain-containing protein [Bradyrhizobium sp. CCBAU 11361]MDA9488295.1 acetyl-CoA acetyltransferase [Bradyrhizobium sp. CCBAU 11361]